jgi:hypothetical protein
VEYWGNGALENMGIEAALTINNMATYRGVVFRQVSGSTSKYL